MKRHIYLVTLKKVDYDQYRGFVVIADNKADALKICDCDVDIPKSYSNCYKDNVEDVVCIGNTNKKKTIVLSDFNAG